MVRHGQSLEKSGRIESYAEDDDFTFMGDSYTVRVTALFPYKDYKNKKDELFANIDWVNNTKGTKGRFEEVWIEARLPNEELRRHSAYRTLRRLLSRPTGVGRE